MPEIWIVTPAQAGAQTQDKMPLRDFIVEDWVPAFAGTTMHI